MASLDCRRFLIIKIDCSYGTRLKGVDVSAPIFSEGTCREEKLREILRLRAENFTGYPTRRKVII